MSRRAIERSRDRADARVGVGVGVGGWGSARGSEGGAEGGQLGDDLVDLVDAPIEELAGGRARTLPVVGCVENLGDLVDVQSELAGGGDEPQPGDLGVGVDPVAVRGAGRGGE